MGRDLRKIRSLRDPKAWRHRAEWARLNAEQITDPAAGERQLRLAESYERFARFAEERIAAEERMPISRKLRDRALDPELVEIVTQAFQDTLRELKLINPEDPMAERVAAIILDCVERGMRDPMAIRDCVMDARRI